jgi:hypothetical protein
MFYKISQLDYIEVGFYNSLRCVPTVVDWASNQIRKGGEIRGYNLFWWYQLHTLQTSDMQVKQKVSFWIRPISCNH